MMHLNHQNGAVSLNNPTLLPNACGFLWNKNMMIQMNCRGYAVAQFMQPEPAKYAHAPCLEAKTFIQPEHPYFTHHPGRFFYIKDNQSQQFFSIPYEPVRTSHDKFQFIVAKDNISWRITHLDIEIELRLTLAADTCAELWQISLTNVGLHQRDLSLYSYFPVGYMSWMNQSARFHQSLNGILCSSVSPYQKVEQYFANQTHKDCTVLLTDAPIASYETRQSIFEGETIAECGLHRPQGLLQAELDNGQCDYQTPLAALHSLVTLAPKQTQSFNYVFAPVKDKAEAESLKLSLLKQAEFESQQQQYRQYLQQGDNGFSINSPDQDFDHFVNHWLARQAFYHGDVNRLSTDPQTRNYLQDAMGMIYSAPDITKNALITALSQQSIQGAMPDGILLHEQAELKYINQVPHTDHGVWVIIALQAYLIETNDYAFLQQQIAFSDTEQTQSVFEHVHLALMWLVSQSDERGLSYIDQGDWCDPMNMVGYKGRGVSSWLSLASAYALNLWAEVALHIDQPSYAQQYKTSAQQFNHAVNQHCWHQNWYGRGITDNNRLFGTANDIEGRIFLNPQSWALLSGAASNEKWLQMKPHIQQQLSTPFGMMMLAPSYTKMHEDIGRVTQKFPGTAENGSVYNHAAIFYIYALFQQGESQLAYELLANMLPQQQNDDFIKRGQLPVFIPNYYRGAYFQFPDTAGKSSQLFNTGTVAWFYRCVIEELCGLKGCAKGLLIMPKLPKHWQSLQVTRQFRGASFAISITKHHDIDQLEVWQDGQLLAGNCIENIRSGQQYQLTVKLARVC